MKKQGVRALLCVCIATVLVGANAASASPKPPGPSPVSQRLGLRTVFYHAVRKELLKEGISKKGADCIVGEIKDRLTDADFRQLESGKTPRGLNKKATQAGRVCAGRLGPAVLA